MRVVASVLMMIDTWVIHHVFQRIVDLLKWSPFGLAMRLMCAATGCAVFTGGLLFDRQFWVIIPALYLLVAVQWAMRARMFWRLEQAAAAGHTIDIEQPKAIANRVFCLGVMFVFWYLSYPHNDPPWLGFTLGWTMATCAYYFAACKPTRP